MSFIEKIPFVRMVKKDGRRMNVALNDGVDSQTLLHELAGHSRIRSFEVKSAVSA